MPLLAILAVLVWRPRWRPLAVAGACSLAAGSIWYVVNLVHTGDLLGDFPGDQRGGAGWYVAPSRTLTATCVEGWQPVLGTSSGWTILRRTIWRC